MATMLSKIERNQAHIDTLQEKLQKLRAEGAQKEEACRKEVSNQEDVASAAEEHGKVLHTELRFRGKALAKTSEQLAAYEAALAEESTLKRAVLQYQAQVTLRDRLTSVMNSVNFDLGTMPMLLEFARLFRHRCDGGVACIACTPTYPPR